MNRPRGTAAIQCFLGKPVDSKVFLAPGTTVEMVGLMFGCSDAVLIGRKEVRPIHYGQETPPVLQLVFPREALEQIIGFLSAVREITADTPQEESRIITPDMSNPATESTE